MLKNYLCKNTLPKPQEPIRIAIIGGGNRSWSLYRLLLPALKPWIKVVAVYDPVEEHANRLGTALGVPVFSDIHALMIARPMEAALISTPIESHYAYSMYCSSHGVHNIVETMFCNLTGQATRMVETARDNQVVVRMAENFFRFPVDRFARMVMDSQYIGAVRRIVSYSDFTGYHNNSRWLYFAQSHPTWAQSISHTMNTLPHRSFAHRLHHSENFSARFFGFEEGFLVSDQAANIKGLLGRQPRPGYTEWQGNQGALVYQSRWPNEHLKFNDIYPFANLQQRIDEDLGHIEIRRCDVDQAGESMTGLAKEYLSATTEYNDEQIWTRISAQSQSQKLEYSNTFFPVNDTKDPLPADAASVMETLVDFALAVRGLKESEFNDEDARMSLMMEVAARESALQEGRRIALPLTIDTEIDAIEEQRLRKAFHGIDPFDVEAMLAINYPRP